MDTLEAQDISQAGSQASSNSEWSGFCTQDIIWAVGVWSVILTLSPVVMFYMLMVN